MIFTSKSYKNYHEKMGNPHSHKPMGPATVQYWYSNANHQSFSWMYYANIWWMEEILHHLGWLKAYK
jgi:hypothetical protein